MGIDVQEELRKDGYVQSSSMIDYYLVYRRPSFEEPYTTILYDTIHRRKVPDGGFDPLYTSNVPLSLSGSSRDLSSSVSSEGESLDARQPFSFRKKLFLGTMLALTADSTNGYSGLRSIGDFIQSIFG